MMDRQITLTSVPPVHPTAMQSRFMRNTWMIAAQQPLVFNDRSSVRYLALDEANNLARALRRYNMPARVPYQNNFYIDRVLELANGTVIEVLREGSPQAIREEAAHVADLIEMLVLLSSTFDFGRVEFLKKVGIYSKRRNEVDIVIGPQTQGVSSRSEGTKKFGGIKINARFKNRFENFGFGELYDYCRLGGDLGKRLTESATWLFESRMEPSEHAAVLKTSIALETLLIFADSEPLGRCLAERLAFILSSDPEVRQQLGHIVLKFYDARSAIIHGHRKKPASTSVSESLDQLLILTYLTVSHNKDIWGSIQQFRAWLDSQRWGLKGKDVRRPFSAKYLKNAMAIAPVAAFGVTG